MPRPTNCRRIGQAPAVTRFKPAGIPCRELEAVTLTLDEFEAIRLTDLEGMYQAQAAEMMDVSRPTLSRIIESAHAKMASMLVHGKELRIEGGFITTHGQHDHDCPRCSRLVAGGTACPRCRKSDTQPQVEEHPEIYREKGDTK